MRIISTSNGCRSIASVERRIRPRASEISLPAPVNLPLGDDHVSSASSFELTFFMTIDLVLARPGVNGLRSDVDGVSHMTGLQHSKCPNSIPARAHQNRYSCG